MLWVIVNVSEITQSLSFICVFYLNYCVVIFILNECLLPHKLKVKGLICEKLIAIFITKNKRVERWDVTFVVSEQWFKLSALEYGLTCYKL